MQNKLFYTLLLIVIATVSTSLFGFIFNLTTSPEKELPLVKFLLTGTVLSIFTLVVEITRRWFIQSKITDGSNEILLDIIGAAVVMNAPISKKVDNDLRELVEYYEEHILGAAPSDEFVAEELREQIVKRVKKYKSLKFRISELSAHVPQVKNH